MKESKYNFYARQDDDIWIYNSVSKKVVKIKDSVLKNLKKSIVNIPVRQHRKSGRRETVCPGLRKPLMRVYSRNVLSKP